MSRRLLDIITEPDQTIVKMNIYRVYSDPKGSDQRYVLAPAPEVAIAAVDLVNRKDAKCYWVRQAMPSDAHRALLVRADVQGFKNDHQ
jgi:hypothetical protein